MNVPDCAVVREAVIVVCESHPHAQHQISRYQECEFSATNRRNGKSEASPSSALALDHLIAI